MVLSGAAAPSSSDSPRVRPPRYATVFDFLAERDRGHVYVDGLVIDFKSAARHKYTAGDWQRSWGFRPAPDGAAVLTGRRGTVRFFNSSEARGGVIGIVGRGAKAAGCELVLNGVPVGVLRFSHEDPSYAEVSFSSGLRRGENRVEIIPKYTVVESNGREGWLEISLMRIASERERETAEPASREQPIRGVEMQPDGLLLPEGGILSFNLLRPGATQLMLDIAARDGGSGQLEVSVVGDSGAFASVSRAPADGTAPESLAPISSREAAVTVSLQAILGDVVLRDARLVRRMADDDAAVPRALPPVRNVLLMVVDTLRADRLRVYNRSSRVNTRHLDQLARSAVVFERATAQGNWTKPSVATILSGLYPTTHGAYTHKAMLDPSIATAPAHLRRMGFESTGFVANGYISSRFGFEKGWDRFESYPQEGKSSRAGAVLADVGRWMKQRSGTGRFFTYVHTVDPHAPYAAPRHFWSQYDRSVYRGVVRPRQTATLINRIKAGTLLLGSYDVRRLKALYNGEISYHDEVFGALLREMKQRRIFDDTVVIVTSDHGEEFLDHGSVGHGHSLFEELVHVPLIIRVPDGFPIAGRRVRAEVGLVDILPTMCDLLQVPCPPAVQGRSLVPLMTTDTELPETPTIAEFPNERQYAVTTEAYKAIFRGFDAALYDMADNDETLDVGPDHPILLMAMTDRLGAHVGRARARIGGDNRPAASLDAETQARLRALGYTGD